MSGERHITPAASNAIKGITCPTPPICTTIGNSRTPHLIRHRIHRHSIHHYGTRSGGSDVRRFNRPRLERLRDHRKGRRTVGTEGDAKRYWRADDQGHQFELEDLSHLRANPQGDGSCVLIRSATHAPGVRGNPPRAHQRNPTPPADTYTRHSSSAPTHTGANSNIGVCG